MKKTFLVILIIFSLFIKPISLPGLSSKVFAEYTGMGDVVNKNFPINFMPNVLLNLLEIIGAENLIVKIFASWHDGPGDGTMKFPDFTWFADRLKKHYDYGTYSYVKSDIVEERESPWKNKETSVVCSQDGEYPSLETMGSVDLLDHKTIYWTAKQVGTYYNYKSPTDGKYENGEEMLDPKAALGRCNDDNDGHKVDIKVAVVEGCNPYTNKGACGQQTQVQDGIPGQAHIEYAQFNPIGGPAAFATFTDEELANAPYTEDELEKYSQGGWGDTVIPSAIQYERIPNTQEVDTMCYTFGCEEIGRNNFGIKREFDAHAATDCLVSWSSEQRKYLGNTKYNCRDYPYNY